MARRALPLLSLLALTAVVVWLLWPEQPPSYTAAPADGNGSEQSEAGVLATATEPSAAAERTEVLVDEVSPGDDVRPTLPSYDGDDGFVVRVVDGFTGEVCADTTVLYARHFLLSSERRAEIREMGLDAREYMELVGDGYRTGADGTVRVPPFERACYLAAMDETSFFRIYLRARDARDYIELPLLPEAHLEVLVLDAQDRPVPDMPVDLRYGAGRWQRGDIEEVTDADGRVLLRHAQLSLAGERQESPWHVSLAIPLAEPVQQRIKLESLPSMPIVLRAPATGAIEFTLLDHLGELVRERAYVIVQTPEKPDPSVIQSDSGFNPADERGAVTARSETGTMRIDHVGLGLKLEYGAMFPISEWYERGEIDGPQDPGQLLRLTLRQQSSPRMISGKILTSDGAPYASQVGVPMRVGHIGGSSGFRLDTDDAGVFRMVARRSIREKDRQRTATVTVVDKERPGTVLLACGRYDGPHVEGEKDLGEFRLGGETVAAGRVVDQAGKPIADATITLQWRITVADGKPNWRDYYEPEAELPRTSDDGRFAFLGTVPGANFRLRILCPGFERIDLPVELGSRDVEVVMKRTTELRFELLLPDFLSADELRIGVIKDSEAGMDRGRLLGEWMPISGELDRLLGLPDGALEFQVWTQSNMLLAHVEGIAAATDGVREDPRLTPLDLRNTVHELELELDFGNAAPAEVGRVWRAGASELHSWRTAPEDNPLQLRLVCDQSPQTVSVSAQDFRTGTTTLEEGVPARLVLEPGIPVRIRFDAADASVPDAEVAVTLAGSGRWSDHALSNRWQDVDLRACDTGPATIYLRMTMPIPDTDRTMSVQLAPGGEHWVSTEIVDDGEVQLITISITQETIENARKQVRESNS